ncbi:MAG: His/Gly/Thr/Pro-type tRNA ligase C-terminal domain-containing protein, partial [bacterium]
NEINAIPQKETNLIYTAVLGDNARQVAFNLVSLLRSRGYQVETDFMRRSLKAQMRDAGKKLAKWVIIIGTDEIQNDKIVLKNMASGEQKELRLSLAADQIETIVK